MKIGVLSCAHMHAESYVNVLKEFKNVQVVGIADEREIEGKNFAQRNNIAYYKDYKKFLLEEDMDTVIICSENAKHAEMAIYAARLKKHVIVEKPIATTIEDAKKMIEECKKNGVKLMVTFPVRYEPSVARTKEIIDSGKIGEVAAINATNHGSMPGGWFIDKNLSGGGCIIDHTVHVLDLINWMFRTNVKEVYAKKATLLNDISVEDAGLLSMEFENGMYATLDTSWSRPKSYPTWGDITMEIVGTKGAINLDAFAQHGELYSNNLNQSQYVHWGDDMNYLMIKDFIKCIEEDKPAPVTGEDGLYTLEAALMAYESAEKNEVVGARV